MEYSNQNYPGCCGSRGGKPGAVPNPTLGGGRSMGCERTERKPTRLGCRDSWAPIDQYPIAMAYVPWQKFWDLYGYASAFEAGTLFRELEKPFQPGRCVRR